MNKNAKTVLAVLLIAAIAGTLIILLANVRASPPPPPPGQGVDTDGDGVADTIVSFSMYQALRIAYTDGTDSWKYPSSRTDLPSMMITDTTTTGLGKPVGSSQAYIFFTLIASKQVSVVHFTATCSVQIYDNSRLLAKDLGEQLVDQSIANPQNGSDTYVNSATITSSDMEALYTPTLAQELYWVIKCRDISASVTFTDGTHANFFALGLQGEENQLWWHYYYTPHNYMMQSVSMEWLWK